MKAILRRLHRLEDQFGLRVKRNMTNGCANDWSPRNGASQKPIIVAKYPRSIKSANQLNSTNGDFRF
jgi:hypothetical protein